MTTYVLVIYYSIRYIILHFRELGAQEDQRRLARALAHPREGVEPGGPQFV